MVPDGERTDPWVLQVSADTPGADADDCGHDSRQHLGGDAGGNAYFRCQQCEAVLIQEGTVSWKEQRESGEEALAEREQGDNPLRGLLESEEGGIFDRGSTDEVRRERPDGSVTVRVRQVLRRITGR